MPKTVKFAIDDSNPNDQYAKLYSPKVVDIVKDLHLPRYGLGNYVLDNPGKPPSKEEERQIDDLSRAGKRLIGFCRTNLFKRLESSGAAFLQSVERHVLRNYVFLTPSETTCLCPSARRTPKCWTPDSPTRTRTRRRALS